MLFRQETQNRFDFLIFINFSRCFLFVYIRNIYQVKFIYSLIPIARKWFGLALTLSPACKKTWLFFWMGSFSLPLNKSIVAWYNMLPTVMRFLKMSFRRIIYARFTFGSSISAQTCQGLIISLWTKTRKIVNDARIIFDLNGVIPLKFRYKNYFTLMFHSK